MAQSIFFEPCQGHGKNLTKPVKIKIRDHEYLVKSEENEEQVQKIAQYVSDTYRAIEENTEGLSERKTAILVAFHIASDYFQLLNSHKEQLESVEQRARALIYQLDAVAN